MAGSDVVPAVVEEEEAVLAVSGMEKVAAVESSKGEKAVGKEKKVKIPKAKKPKSIKTANVSSAAHPSYLLMVKEAISTLKERTGSSQYAIAKYLEDMYKVGLPPNFKKILSIQLRNMTKQGKVYKVKNSFKLSDELKKPIKAPKTAMAIKEGKEVKAHKPTKVAKKPASRVKSKTANGALVPKAVKVGAVVKPTKVPKSPKAPKLETKSVKLPKAASKPRKVPAAASKKDEEKVGVRNPAASAANKVAAVKKTAPKKVGTPRKAVKSVKSVKSKSSKSGVAGKTSKTVASPAKRAKK